MAFEAFLTKLLTVSSPDERSDIRDNSSTAPDIATLIRATLATLAGTRVA